MATKLVDELPGWLKIVLAISGVVISLTLSYAAVQADARIESVERKAADALLQQQQDRLQRDIEEIKNLLQREFERHHGLQEPH